MDVTCLLTNIPPNESIDRSVHSFWKFLQNNPPIPTHYPGEMLRLIRKENSLQFYGKLYTYKPTVPRWAQRQQFPLPTFSCHILKHKVGAKPSSNQLFGNATYRHFSVWDINIPDTVAYFEQGSLLYPSFPSYHKFTTEIHWDNMLLDTVVYKGTRFNGKTILDVKTHFKQTETLPAAHTSPGLSPTNLSKEKP